MRHLRPPEPDVADDRDDAGEPLDPEGAVLSSDGSLPVSPPNRDARAQSLNVRPPVPAGVPTRPSSWGSGLPRQSRTRRRRCTRSCRSARPGNPGEGRRRTSRRSIASPARSAAYASIPVPRTPRFGVHVSKPWTRQCRDLWHCDIARFTRKRRRRW
jgi:hypothetical protein